jgi:hypothetical protein
VEASHRGAGDRRATDGDRSHGAGAPDAGKDSIDERIVEIQQGKRLLFDEFARAARP